MAVLRPACQLPCWTLPLAPGRARRRLSDGDHPLHLWTVVVQFEAFPLLVSHTIARLAIGDFGMMIEDEGCKGFRITAANAFRLKITDDGSEMPVILCGYDAEVYFLGSCVHVLAPVRLVAASMFLIYRLTSRLSSFIFNYFLRRLKVISPMLHHARPRLQVECVVVGSAHSIARPMR